MVKETIPIRLSIGGVIRTTITVFLQNYVPFLEWALLVVFPVVLIDEVIADPSGIYAFALYLLYTLATALLAIPVICNAALYMYFRWEGFTRVSSALGTWLTFTYVEGRGHLGWVSSALGTWLAFTLLARAGLTLFIVPGLFVLVIFWVSLPVSIIERKGVLASFRRSAELTKGHRWRILGIVAMTVVCWLVVGVISGAVGVGLDALIDFAFDRPVGLEPGFFGMWFSFSVAMAWHMVALAVSYQFLVAEGGATVPDRATRAAHS